VPTCPTWLHREAKREWRRIVPHLEQLGLLTQVDRAALAAYCQLYARWWEAERAIREHGLTQETESGYVTQRPEVGIANTALTQMRRYLVEFGLTPAARTRIDAPTAPERPRNAFADL
jgi:P27 family predicted phage terminase small subunit